MFDLISQHKFLTVIGTILVIAGAWYGLNAGFGTSSTSSLATSTPSGCTPGDELVATLLTLRTVNLNGTILSDSTFSNLRDFTTQIIPESFGRPNPFVPIGQSALQAAVSAVSDATSTRNTMLFAPRQTTTGH